MSDNDASRDSNREESRDAEENSRDVDDVEDSREGDSRPEGEEDSGDVEDSNDVHDDEEGEDTNEGAAADDDDVVEIKQAPKEEATANGDKNGVAEVVAAAREVSEKGDADVAVVIIPKDDTKPVEAFATNGDPAELIEQSKQKRARNVDEDGISVDPALAPTQPKQQKSQ